MYCMEINAYISISLPCNKMNLVVGLCALCLSSKLSRSSNSLTLSISRDTES